MSADEATLSTAYTVAAIISMPAVARKASSKAAVGLEKATPRRPRRARLAVDMRAAEAGVRRAAARTAAMEAVDAQGQDERAGGRMMGEIDDGKDTPENGERPGEVQQDGGSPEEGEAEEGDAPDAEETARPEGEARVPVDLEDDRIAATPAQATAKKAPPPRLPKPQTAWLRISPPWGAEGNLKMPEVWCRARQADVDRCKAQGLCALYQAGYGDLGARCRKKHKARAPRTLSQRRF